MPDLTASQPQPGLRERLRRAIAEGGGWDFDSLEPHDFQDETTAVLAVVQPLLDAKQAEMEEGLRRWAHAEPTCGVGSPRQAATCTDPPLHDDDHHDAFGHTWPRRADDKPLFTKET